MARKLLGGVVPAGPLELPTVYQLFQGMLISSRRRRAYVAAYVRPRPGDHVLDIGCGPGTMLEYLPSVDYVGFDLNPRYIAWATAKYRDRGRFYHRRVSPDVLKGAGEFDLILANGVLHHLGDQDARTLFKLAQESLAPDGRLITFDGCYVEGQHPIARYFLSRDRGRFVRVPEDYLSLAHEVFPSVQSYIRHDLLRVPYTHIVLECHSAISVGR